MNVLILVNKITMYIFLFFSLNIATEQDYHEIKFISANPFSFQDVILYLDNLDSIQVSGKLRLPKENKEQYPLIVGVAGSLGWRDHHHEFLQMYRDMGIATFELNSFESRGITSTVGTQVEVTTAMIILDAYRALDVLVDDFKIDKDNIAITGWSLGGAVSAGSFQVTTVTKNSIVCSLSAQIIDGSGWDFKSG